MKPVEGIIGPGMSPNDLNLVLPDCVKLQSQADNDSFKSFVDTVVRATSRNAHRVLRSMLAQTPGAEKLAEDFSKRLGI